MGSAVSAVSAIHDIEQVVNAPREATPKSNFLISRIVAAECDFIDPSRDQVIHLGVSGETNAKSPYNPLSDQAIQIGGLAPLQAMVDCVSTPTSVQYSFEGDTYLHIFRRGEDVMYHLKTPVLEATRKIDPVVARMFKPIGVHSAEIDALRSVFQPEHR